MNPVKIKKSQKQNINSIILPSDEKMDKAILNIMAKHLSVFKDNKGKCQDIICNRFSASAHIRLYFKKLIKNQGNKKAKKPLKD